jgi:Bacterial Ig-like domain
VAISIYLVNKVTSYLDLIFAIAPYLPDLTKPHCSRAPLRVTIDSALPQVTLTTPVDTQPLIPGARLTGSVDGTGSTVASLSYRFDTRAEIAVPFNATGAFEQSLELTGLSNGAHTLTISTTDKAGNVKTAQYNVSVNIDINAPTIAAVLVNDTALSSVTNTDRITSDPTIAGNVIDASRVVEFRAGFDTTTTANFVSILPQRQADGSFRLDRTQLESIYGSTTLPDGTHTLHLQAVDEYSNTSNVFDFTFTLDTTPPVEPVLRLNPISDSTSSNNLQTTEATVTLIGQTEANATILLQETNSTTTADASGNFQFIGVHLNLGANALSLRIMDVAGNTSVFTETITRDRKNDVVLDWNATLLNAIKIDSTAPPLASRNMAMVHTAIYDAVNAIAKNYSVYHVDAQAPAETSSAAAAAEAAYGVLINLYPNQKTTFDVALLASLAAIPDGTAENNGIALGQQVAQQILDWRSTDGSKTVLERQSSRKY